MKFKKISLGLKKHVNDSPEFSAGIIRDIVDGYKAREWVMRNLAYIFFVVILVFFYIGNRYSSERTISEIARLDKELKELRFESITTASELMSLSRLSAVSNMVKEKGIDLEQSMVPPKKLEVKD